MASRKRKLTSEVWTHFTPDDDGITATCNTCLRQLRTPKRCTSTLRRHLSDVHQVYLDVVKRDAVSPRTGMSQLEFISKLAAVDGISFSTIANSECIQLSFSLACNATLPKSASSVRDLVRRQYEATKQKVIGELHEVEKRGLKLAVTLDEWSSTANKRYLNINLHVRDRFWTLGLARIRQSFTSEACLELVEEKLQDFGVRFNQVSAFTSDGASVMKRFGRISGKLHQICMSHGIHLAIVDVMYDKNPSSNIVEQENVEQGGDEDTSLSSSFVVEDEPIVYAENLGEVISKVRKVVQFFRHSPSRSDILRSHDPREHQLILDTKTRWNSALAMLERFSLMKDAIRKAYIDLQADLPVSEDDFLFVKDIVDALTPVKLAVDRICKRDATLFTADVAINFMLEKLSQLSSRISQKLFIALKSRIQERRTYLSDILSFLHFNEDTAPGYEKYFEKISDETVTERIKKIYETFGDSQSEDYQEEQCSEETEASESLTCEVSLETELNLAINHANCHKTARAKTWNQRGLSAQITRELQVFKRIGDRGRILEFVYNLLLAVPPSSVEAERVFSSANSFCSKTRSRLGDSSLSELVFLKWYFARK